MMLPSLLLIAIVPSALSPAQTRGPWLPDDPGPARAFAAKNTITLKNRDLACSWQVSGGHLSPSPTFGSFLFTVVLKSGQQVAASALRIQGTPKSSQVHADPKASRAADRIPGKAIDVDLADPASGLTAHWHAVLRDSSNYMRQEVTLRSTKLDLNIAEVRMVDLTLKDAKVAGSAPGSPIVSRNAFFGMEHPMAHSKVDGTHVTSALARGNPLLKGQSVTYSSVFGIAAPGQMRRGFLAYVERERAHPYRPFLHYNSWYDLGYFTQFDEKQCVDRINAFGENLVRKRGVHLASFLFDDGWDNYESVWEFHKGFPNGFLPLKAAAAKYGAGPGVWLSPWGGYGNPRQRRLAYGKAHGMEVDSQGYALSGPNYYKRFHDVTMDFVTRQGINQFKFDGTGSPDKKYPGSAFDSDFEAAIQLISDLRKARPDLFVNLTTGTWPSPFWLRYADSTWRGGSDHDFAGVGLDRERWITYKDGDTYRGVVQRGPLYPLSSLMLHGLIYAQHAHNLQTDPSGAFRHEVRAYFGNGTELQEMYITPSLLSERNWDDLAEAANWSYANQDVLLDTHWVAGDPSKLEVYGWASWNARKGILTLRNPSDKPQAFSIDPQLVFELPSSAKGIYRFRSPWKEDAGNPPISIAIGQSKVMMLQPFEVLTLEAGK